MLNGDPITEEGLGSAPARPIKILRWDGKVTWSDRFGQTSYGRDADVLRRSQHLQGKKNIGAVIDLGGR